MGVECSSTKNRNFFTMSNDRAGSFSMLKQPVTGTTGTGLDQLVDVVFSDTSLAGSNTAPNLLAGAAAADGMNQIILQAAAATGAGADGQFTEAEVLAMNGWIRANKLPEWLALHGDDEGNVETGFHLVQNDGAQSQYRGNNLVDTVADGLYHMGFEVQNGRFVNEDGDANATVTQVAAWLTQFYTDHSTTGTGLDRITNAIMADAGLSANISDSDIAQGADQADLLNHLIMDGLKASSGWTEGKAVSVADVTALNAWIRADAGRFAYFLQLHGDDENGEETGYHLVQNDGANTAYFGKNLVNTVADGLYHIGFEIQDGQFLNEDGNANAKVSDVADWLTYFLADVSDTGTGLDRIVDTIKADTGLVRNTRAADIHAGAHAANDLNKLLIEAIQATNAMADGWLTSADLQAMNDWLRADPARYARFLELHGDDENGEETGYHLVQNDGANTRYFGQNLINGPADSIYHFGFTIENGRFVNEDGDANAAVSDVAAWLNYFLKGSTLIVGSDEASVLNGTEGQDQVRGQSKDDTIDAGAGDDLIEAGWGNDTVQGGAGNDLIFGQGGDDQLDGGAGSDTYRVTGNQAGGWSSFQGFDTYADSGSSGTDTLQAIGSGDVDLGVKAWGSTGIEVIDTSAASGTVRLLGDSAANTLDLRNTNVIGQLTIDGGYGDDTIIGNAAANVIVGGSGEDSLDGGNGADTYRVTGNQAGGWSSFHGFDTYADSGSSGTDTLQAIGSGDVDIGVKGWNNTGIEVIDARGASGTVRLLGDGAAETFDLRSTSLLGNNIVIDAGHGDDTVYGNAAANVIIGGGGNDRLDGGNGSDTYRVTGNQAGGWSSFQGFDTYADSGSSGTDTIRVVGQDVDIGTRNFSASSSGIEVIDARAATGTTRMVGEWSNDSIDLRGISVLGSLTVDTGGGNDTLVGSLGNDVLLGGSGHDVLLGGAGVDTLNGGEGNDLLLATQGGSSARELYVGGAGNDWMALALNDRSTLELRGGSVDAADGAVDTVTLVGTRGALAFSAYWLDFEVGKDRIDLSQLRDSSGNRLGMEDLVISSSNGSTQVGFADGVHAVGGGAVDVQLHLVGVVGVAASSFSFNTPSMSGGLATLDTAFAYL